MPDDTRNPFAPDEAIEEPFCSSVINVREVSRWVDTVEKVDLPIGVMSFGGFGHSIAGRRRRRRYRDNA